MQLEARDAADARGEVPAIHPEHECGRRQRRAARLGEARHEPLDPHLTRGEHARAREHQRRVDVGAALREPHARGGERLREILEEGRGVEPLGAEAQRVGTTTDRLPGDPHVGAVESRLHREGGVAVAERGEAIQAGGQVARHQRAAAGFLEDERAMTDDDPVDDHRGPGRPRRAQTDQGQRRRRGDHEPWRDDAHALQRERRGSEQLTDRRRGLDLVRAEDFPARPVVRADGAQGEPAAEWIVVDAGHGEAPGRQRGQARLEQQR